MDLTPLHFLSQASAVPNGWEFWPFSSGYGEKWLPMIARMGFMLVIFGIIALFLRLLFGPKGFLRDKEMDREAEELRRQELDELEEEYRNGEWTETQYRRRKRNIERS
ncbi:MAG: SHOCT domain-containing protein [Desulfovibrio sp.]